MWSVLEEYDIKGNLLKAIKSTYKDQLSSVGGGTTFEIENGVRQGSVLSPILFIIYMDRVMREVTQIEGETYCFAYADDIAQTARSKHQLEQIMERWNNAFVQYGLKLSINKTEYMAVTRQQHHQEDFMIGEHSIKQTNTFAYLGSNITSKNEIEADINNRISKYSKNMGFLYPLLREKEIPRQVKTHIYKTILQPILLYGSETWTLTERLKS